MQGLSILLLLSKKNLDRIDRKNRIRPEPIVIDATTDTPLYFPLAPEYSVGQSPPTPIEADQFGQGGIDGRVFQFACDAESILMHKRQTVAAYGDQHVGRCRLPDQAQVAVGTFIANRLADEYPNRFDAGKLARCRFEELAMLVPEDLAITCARLDEAGSVVDDWLAAVHVCSPSGWRPCDKLGRSFSQIHRTVQITSAPRFLLDPSGRIRDFARQMFDCTQPHVRFIWTVQRGDGLNRNPHVQPARQNAPLPLFFRVERQTITSFPDAQASLFTIRTYRYPLARIVEDPARRAALRQAVESMPTRVRSYKGWDDVLVDAIVSCCERA